MRLARATILEQDYHHGLRLREKGTNGICAGIRTAREDGPSKYPMMKTVLVLATVVAMLHAKSYKMETRSSGSLIARLIKDNLYHKYLENQRFHRTQVHKKGSQPIMDHHDYFYLANITFGTPGQTVSLMMDTSSSNLWVIDAACNTDACNGRFDVPYTRRKFDSTKSSTFSTTNNTIFILQQYGSCTGILVNDTVSFADLTIDQQEFADIADMDGYLPSRPFDGIFGLGWPVVASGEVSPPMQNILPDLDAPLFTIWMDRGIKDALNAAESPGLITYGAIDTTNCQSDLNYVSLSSEAYWQFNIEGFSVGSFSESGHGEVSADTAISFIGAPGYIVDAVVSQTGAQFDILYGFYKVDCSTMKTQPDLVFSINGFKYNIPPEEYLFDYGIEEGQCILGLYNTNSGGFGTTWTFGNPWLRTFCNIFDIGGKRIGFATANHSKS